MTTTHQPSSWENGKLQPYWASELREVLKPSSGRDKKDLVTLIKEIESSALKRGMAHELTDEELENSAYFKARIKIARDEGIREALEVLPKEKETDFTKIEDTGYAHSKIRIADANRIFNLALHQSKEAILKLLDL